MLKALSRDTDTSLQHFGILISSQLVLLMLKVTLAVFIDTNQQVRDLVKYVLMLRQARINSLVAILRAVVVYGHQHVLGTHNG